MTYRGIGLLLVVACGAGSTPQAPTTEPSNERSGLTPEEAVYLCHDQGGPRRTDYPFIANYRCPDGSVPLGGDTRRGAAARVGNVGEGPEGHILDLYEVPCPSGAIRIYVDAYHCDRDVEIDPNNIDNETLLSIAAQARAFETRPFDERAAQLRTQMTEWLGQTGQVHLDVCSPLLTAIAHREYAHGRMIFEQFLVSTAASVIETQVAGGEANPRAAAQSGAHGALRLHESIIAERASEGDPQLLDLATAYRESRLERAVDNLLQECQPTLGFTMTTDEGNVWPPEGPDCDRLVRCCESNGLVQNGAAVSGTSGMTCLLAASGESDCSAGLSMLAAANVQCD